MQSSLRLAALKSSQKCQGRTRHQYALRLTDARNSQIGFQLKTGMTNLVKDTVENPAAILNCCKPQWTRYRHRQHQPWPAMKGNCYLTWSYRMSPGYYVTYPAFAQFAVAYWRCRRHRQVSKSNPLRPTTQKHRHRLWSIVSIYFAEYENTITIKNFKSRRV